MKIILKQDIESLGAAGETVTVKNGYARNYLIPQGLAVAATAGNLRAFEVESKAAALRLQRGMREAQEVATRLEKLSLTVSVQVGEEDKLFGSVTSQNIADLLAENGFKIDKKKIVLDDPIKALGVYEVPVKLHPEVTGVVKVWVVRE
ncbi:MAG TPA: 50S ribosomal protein L9 [bacterium]|nr:50S ribosomal protein L9 [bacterium]HQI47271.1 50S ribosomal protein L9 [bacterium]HQJ64220.1 50S ribosomal protein L9 [bacterium]